MLLGHKDKDLTKGEMQNKVDAWKTLNSVLVKANSEFMSSLHGLLASKKAQQEELKLKLEKGEGTEQDNAEYIFLGGYVQALQDVLNAKPQS